MMRTIWARGCHLFSCACRPSLMPTASRAQAGAELVEGWTAAVTSGDADRVASVLAPEFQLMRQSGAAYDAEAYVAGGFPAIAKAPAVEDVVETGDGDIRVVRYWLVIDETVDGAALTRRCAAADRLPADRRWLVRLGSCQFRRPRGKVTARPAGTWSASSGATARSLITPDVKVVLPSRASSRSRRAHRSVRLLDPLAGKLVDPLIGSECTRTFRRPQPYCDRLQVGHHDVRLNLRHAEPLQCNPNHEDTAATTACHRCGIKQRWLTDSRCLAGRGNHGAEFSPQFP